MGAPSITDLHKFLQKTDATIEFSVRAADGYSGVYRTLAKIYKARQIDVVDRQEQEISDSSNEEDREGTSASSFTVHQRLEPYRSNGTVTMISLMIKRLRLP